MLESNSRFVNYINAVMLKVYGPTNILPVATEGTISTDGTTDADGKEKRWPVSPESVPGIISSSYSENSEFSLSNKNISELLFCGRSREISPSTICRQRKLSAAIVTSNSNRNHEYIAGRPIIPIETLFSLPAMESSGYRETKDVHGHVKKQFSRERSHQFPRPKKHHRRPSGADVPVGIEKKKGYCLMDDPPPLRLETWSDVCASSFLVRGSSYLRDRKKVHSEPSILKLLTVDLVRSDEPILTGLCKYPGERIQNALEREAHTGVQQLPNFIFALNIAIPGPPFYHMVSYFGTDEVEALKSQSTPLGRLASKFFFGKSDQYRDDRFKLIPKIAEGNFIVRRAVGSKPSILGKKVKQYYILDERERYFELVVDVSSDTVAQKVVQLIIGYARTLVVDMMFLLEGTDENTLPEQILGGVRLNNLDFKSRDGQRVCTSVR